MFRKKKVQPFINNTGILRTQESLLELQGDLVTGAEVCRIPKPVRKGVIQRSPLLDLYGFDVYATIPPDVVHFLAEGLCKSMTKLSVLPEKNFANLRRAIVDGTCNIPRSAMQSFFMVQSFSHACTCVGEFEFLQFDAAQDTTAIRQEEVPEGMGGSSTAESTPAQETTAISEDV